MGRELPHPGIFATAGKLLSLLYDSYLVTVKLRCIPTHTQATIIHIHTRTCIHGDTYTVCTKNVEFTKRFRRAASARFDVQLVPSPIANDWFRSRVECGQARSTSKFNGKFRSIPVYVTATTAYLLAATILPRLLHCNYPLPAHYLFADRAVTRREHGHWKNTRCPSVTARPPPLFPSFAHSRSLVTRPRLNQRQTRRYQRTKRKSDNLFPLSNFVCVCNDNIILTPFSLEYIYFERKQQPTVSCLIHFPPYLRRKISGI